VLDDGEALIESTAILDFLDELVGPERAMIAERGPVRRHHLKICALGSGLGDKAVRPPASIRRMQAASASWSASTALHPAQS
jgi:glutathione S-transferase